jgi:lysophospholipase L1-like esterase
LIYTEGTASSIGDPLSNLPNRGSFMIRHFFKLSLCALAILSSVNSYAKDVKTAHLAVTPVPRDVGWMKRHESMNAPVKQANADVVFIGDSITQGWAGAGKKVWEEFYAKRNAVNLGIGGDRTQHVLWRLGNGNRAGISPKLAVVTIGTNNSGNNNSEEIFDGIEAVVENIHSKSPSTKTLLLAIFPRGAHKDDKRRQVNEKANGIASKLTNDKSIFFLDIGPNFLESVGTLSKEVMPDKLHLNASNYRT